MTTIYHIAAFRDWKTAQDGGWYVVSSLDTEGFIHCSTRAQLLRVANERFAGRADLQLLAIDESRVRAEVRYEQAVDVDDKFPHIYGPLNVDAVDCVHRFLPDAQGVFSHP